MSSLRCVAALTIGLGLALSGLAGDAAEVAELGGTQPCRMAHYQLPR